MARFLIEVPRVGAVSCARANKVLLETGSHFLTHADFGCNDGVHKAWIVVDVDSKDEARNILPPGYRREATIVQLNKFALKELDDLSSVTRADKVAIAPSWKAFAGTSWASGQLRPAAGRAALRPTPSA